MSMNFDGFKKPPGWYYMCEHGKLNWRQEFGTNSCGHVGVCRIPNGKFGAKIFDPEEEKTVWIGSYETAEDAGDAFLSAHECIHGPAPKHLQHIYGSCQ